MLWADKTASGHIITDSRDICMKSDKQSGEYERLCECYGEQMEIESVFRCGISH